MAIGNPINLTSNVEGKSISVSATAGQTQFTVTGGYRINQISVYRNGVRLVDGRDFTATDGSIVTLLSAASVDDVVEFQVFDDFRVSDALNVNSGGTVNGDVTVNGALTVSSTFTGTATTAQGLTGSPDIAVTNITAGIITATTFSGNGSALTGVASTDNIITGTAATFTSDVNIADSIIHVGDTNTKIRFPAADTFTIETAGSERIRVGAAGSVGIGTDDPESALHVVGNIPNAPMNFGVHIGAHSGYGIMQFTAATGGIIDFGESGVDSVGRIIYTHSDNALAFQTGNSEAIRIDSSQRLLVNTATTRTNYDNGSVTSNLLHVERTAASGNAGISICANAATAADAGAIIYMGRTSATSNGGNTIVEDDDLIGRISFQGADGSELVEAACIRVDVDGAPAANDMPGRIEFHTTSDGSAGATERVRITSTGRTGININNPDSYNSSGNNLVLGDTGNNAGMTIVSSTTNNGHIFFADGTASGAQNRGIIKYEHGNDAMAFNTAESEAFRIDSSQRLLIGGNSARANFNNGSRTAFLQLEGTSSNIDSSSLALVYNQNSTGNASNIYFGKTRGGSVGDNSALNQAGDRLGNISFQGNDGTQFVDAAHIRAFTDGTPGADDMPGRLVFSTTADGATSPTERLRITSAGLVGIGTATPRDSSTLDVDGGARFSGSVIVKDGGNAGAGVTIFDNGNVAVSGAATIGGILVVRGEATFTTHARWSDNDKAIFGAGDDLQIYHDGTDSRIDNNTGDLYVETTGSGDDIIIKAADDVIIQTQGSEGAVVARGDGTVELYYDNSKKFETTSGGIEVSGNVTGVDATFSGNVSVGGTLTYEDVTNIDSVGVVTARSGIDLAGALKEGAKITSGKLSDNTDINISNGMVHLFTTQETTTSTPNIVSNAGINTDLAVGEAISVTIITTAAAGGYSAQLQIDGSNVTENWSGGSAPDAGGSSGVDIYTHTIIKTGSAAYTVVSALTKTSA